MSTLKIFLFGGMRVLRDDYTSEINLTSVSKSLLAFLVLNRHRSFNCNILMDMFWGDVDIARASSGLRSALWQLQTAVEAEGAANGSYLLVEHQGQEIRFNPQSDFWLDTIEFEKQAKCLEAHRHSMQPINVEEIEYALLLYDNGFLNGFYDDWALREHERYNAMYIDMLNFLTTYYTENRDFTKAVHYGRLVLDQDPLREDIHRTLMSLYVENSQRAMAIRQYQQCKKLLKRELKISPDEKTQALFAEITASEAATGQGWRGTETPTKPDEIQEIVAWFKQTHQAIEGLQSQLQAVASQFDHYLKNRE